MDIHDRITIVTRNVQELITEEELKSLLEVNQNPRAYWGFECSG